MNKLMNTIAIFLVAVMGVSCSVSPVEADYRVIPMPQQVSMTEGDALTLKDGMKISYPKDNPLMKRNAEFLAEYVEELTGCVLIPTTEKAPKGDITLALGLEHENKEAYTLRVDAEGVTIQGASEAGVFYGVQTLRKSLPVGADKVNLPQGEVKDFPRFGYRGMMLDVARHYFTPDSVKRYIDLLALHNINRFHWHLTEDQGWRLEIKKYPQLTEVGSKRKQTVIGRNSGKYDGVPYGGFYTQEEARDIVAYAKERYIEVIPEIDLPGHMQGALACFPELGCTGGPYEVWCQWGVSSDVLCVGNPKTMTFIQDVLTELTDIFPSEYIHIGGDECPKSRWMECPKCQRMIRSLGLRSDKNHSKEEKLQSCFMAQVEAFLATKGRKIIGWDEILEGGMAPNATVMAWRGVEEGSKAARLGHDVIMTPSTHVYFDYYQAEDIDREPFAIGGYLPLKKVYHYEPLPETLTKEEQAHIIGVQANLWTEYIPTFRQAEYMALPRMDALSEVQWTLPENKNYDEFLSRLLRMFDYYDAFNFNYAAHVLGLNIDYKVNAEKGSLRVALSSMGSEEIYYTLDGTEPNLSSPRYTEPLNIQEDCVFQAMQVRGGKQEFTRSEQIAFNKASLKPLKMLQPYHPRYSVKGEYSLVDGMKGDGNLRSGRWVAFMGHDMEAVVDLKQATEVESAGVSVTVDAYNMVCDIRGLKVELSLDGEHFKEVASEQFAPMKKDDPKELRLHELKFEKQETRWVKITALSEHHMPKWYDASQPTGYLFVDEIVVK